MHIAVLTGIFNFIHGATIRVHPNQVCFRTAEERIFGVTEEALGCAEKCDAVVIAPSRLHVKSVSAVRDFCDERLWAEGSLIHVTAVLLTPGYKRDLFTIGTPCGHGFREVETGHTFRRAVGEVHYVQPVQHGEGELLSIRAGCSIADLCGQGRTGIFNGVIKIEAGSHLQGHIGLKWNLRCLATFNR